MPALPPEPPVVKYRTLPDPFRVEHQYFGGVHRITTVQEVPMGERHSFEVEQPQVTQSDQPGNCSCPAPHHPSARFCPRCGGTIRRQQSRNLWATVIALTFIVTYTGGLFFLTKWLAELK